MICRVVTLKFDVGLGGFPEEPLRAAQSSGSLLEVRENFFTMGGVPHMALVLLLDTAVSPRNSDRRASTEDPGAELPENLRPLYRNLRLWRNERARKDGVPSYTLFRNVQLAEVCRKLPRSLAALREIDGIGEATCAKYGAEILALIPAELPPAAAADPAGSAEAQP